MFTELIREIGAKGFQVEELYGLDESLLTDLHPIFGFIFLFKWSQDVDGQQQNSKKPALSPSMMNRDEDIFFAQQTVQNACATQAILSILLNVPTTAMGVELGQDLINLKEFCKDLTPEMRGEAIGENEVLRRVHNSFGRPEFIYVNKEKSRSDSGREEDPFHFISILPVGDTLLEFDGLKSTPISHGTINNEWYGKALSVIQEKIDRIQTLGSGEIRFNLLAVIKDRTCVFRELIDQQIRLICQLEDSLRLQPAQDNDDPRQQQIASLLGQNAVLESQLEMEQEKINEYQKENARRKHNFVPLAIALLKELVKSGIAKS